MKVNKHNSKNVSITNFEKVYVCWDSSQKLNPNSKLETKTLN